MELKSRKLVVLGSVNVDHVMRVQHFPRGGETVRGQQYQVMAGGKGGNQAVACGRLQGDVSFIGCVGQDPFGLELKQRFAEDSIECTGLMALESVSTGVAMIMVSDQAENMIAINGGANAELTPARVEQHRGLIEAAGTLLMQLETPDESVLAAAQLAKAAGTFVVLNPAPARGLSDELLGLVDLITPNQTEAELLTGIEVVDRASAEQAANVLHGRGVSQVIITMGKEGAFISTTEEVSLVPGFTVKAVDTTAAGDTFNGALVVALAEGQSLIEAARFANGAAALAVTRKGAQDAVPTRQDVNAFLNL